MVSDKQLVRQRFEASFRRYDRLAVVQQQICAQLAELAGTHCNRPVRDGLEIGIGTGFLTGRLITLWPDALWRLNDIAPAAEAFVAKYTVATEHAYLWGDAERMNFPPGLDMVASASTVQWFDDLPAFLRRACSATNPGGYLLLSTFGPANFREIREAAGEGLNYYAYDELLEMFGANGYGILAGREYTEALLFDSPVEVLKHVKATGVNSLKKATWSKRQLADFELVYREKFSVEDSVTLTYHPILIVAEKR